EMPLPLGYSAAGVVIEVGDDVDGFAVGDRVATNASHAEIAVVSSRLAAPIPSTVSSRDAAFTTVAAVAMTALAVLGIEGRVIARSEPDGMPFREGLATGLLACQFTPKGDLIVGGTNRGWPVRGPKEFALQRLDWTGVTPFEIHEIKARPNGFALRFTKPVDPESAADLTGYELQTYTHVYQQGYGSPEVDHTTPKVTATKVSADGLQVDIVVDGLVQGHVHDFHLPGMRSTEGEALLHTRAYYTLNEIPVSAD
ncbi:MAG: hypothetical protein AAF497_27900, partial [Planctomycetota bacterium]